MDVTVSVSFRLREVPGQSLAQAFWPRDVQWVGSAGRAYQGQGVCTVPCPHASAFTAQYRKLGGLEGATRCRQGKWPKQGDVGSSQKLTL